MRTFLAHSAGGSLTSSLSRAVALVGLVTLLPHCSDEDAVKTPATAGAAGTGIGEAGDSGVAGSGAGRAGASAGAGNDHAGSAGEAGARDVGTGGEAGEGGSLAGMGGSLAGTGGSLAGTGGSLAGTGGSLAGTGGSNAGTGGVGSPTGGSGGASGGTAGIGGSSGAGGSMAGSAGSVAASIGSYVAGDFHNHTTCSDGSISMQKLVNKATSKSDGTFGLDWFVQAGHGGNGYRNCTLVEDASLSTPAYPFIEGKGPNTSWEDSGVTPKGDPSNAVGSPLNMWRWESIQEFQYPLIEYLNAQKNLPLFLGIETVGPGHEHISMSVITGQVPSTIDNETLPNAPPYVPKGSADGLAQFEYCFDRSDTDTSRGTTNQWDCAVPGSANSLDASWNATAHKLIPTGTTGVGIKGHLKTIESLKWLAANHTNASYYVPAHLERAGQFNPDGNNGYNVEHLRDFNNAAPKTAFGMETQPGHGASANRGEYQVLRNSIGGVPTDSVGGTTFGGTGVYGAVVGGVWDALLGEGRNFWFFASSDWHNRGSFGPDDRRSTQDFFPGEYQRNFTMVKNGTDKLRPQAIVDGLRSGNNFATGGQIIDRLSFVACSGKTDTVVSGLVADAAMNKTTIIGVPGCATMGEKLSLQSAGEVVVGVAVRDPDGANYSPYTFQNPSLKQIGKNVPINKPVLDHIDLIGGSVTGYRTPGTAQYSGEWPRNTNWLLADGTTTGLGNVPDAAKNPSAHILKTFNGNGGSAWQQVTASDGSKYLVMTFHISGNDSQYIRLRGSNLPPSVPFETDADGNPLSDVYTNANDTTRLRIPCDIAQSAVDSFDGCPTHLATATSPASGAPNPIAGLKAVSYDVAAWSDLWFYSNPIYIQLATSTPILGVQ